MGSLSKKRGSNIKNYYYYYYWIEFFNLKDFIYFEIMTIIL